MQRMAQEMPAVEQSFEAMHEYCESNREKIKQAHAKALLSYKLDKVIN